MRGTRAHTHTHAHVHTHTGGGLNKDDLVCSTCPLAHRSPPRLSPLPRGARRRWPLRLGGQGSACSPGPHRPCGRAGSWESDGAAWGACPAAQSSRRGPWAGGLEAWTPGRCAALQGPPLCPRASRSRRGHHQCGFTSPHLGGGWEGGPSRLYQFQVRAELCQASRQGPRRAQRPGGGKQPRAVGGGLLPSVSGAHSAGVGPVLAAVPSRAADTRLGPCPPEPGFPLPARVSPVSWVPSTDSLRLPHSDFG